MSANCADRSLAQRIAGWSSTLALDGIPVEVLEVARRCIVDTVGVSLAARPHPLVQRVFEYAKTAYAGGPASVLGFSERLSPPAAALINGTAAHTLDFDDTSYTGIMHGSAVVFAAALAATEQARGDGRRLLEAFVAGSEVAYAIAMMCTTRHYFRGWWSTATLGVFGGTAAAARALGLSAAQTSAALALAGAQANGQKAAFGSDAKPYIAGRTAAMGVEAALLAARGVSGPTGFMEGRCGFLQLLNDGYSETAQLSELGTLWRLVHPGVYFKRYPVCSGAQAATELTECLLAENRLSACNVRSVVCEVGPVVAISLVYDHPASVQQAQFSMPFAVGVMLARGGLDVGGLNEATLADPRVRAEMAKVEMRRVEALHDDEAPEGARVTVSTVDGRQFSGYLREPTGMPGRPLSEESLHAKFLQCARAGGIEDGAARRLLQRLAAIDQAPASPLWQPAEPVAV